MTKSKSITFWILAVMLSLAFGFYQRITGPTYPIKGKIQLANEEIKYTLPRTHEGADNQIIAIKAGQDVKGYYTFKRYPSYDTLSKAELKRNGEELVAELPGQPPAGKIQYQLYLQKNGEEAKALNKDSVVIRFKGYTPVWIVILHVIFIFGAMIFAIRTGLEAFAKGEKVLQLMKYTIYSTIIGGFIFGPIMQYYAFGAFWTGFPFGMDLTDNKTLIGLVVWLIALWRYKKNPNNLTPVWIAAIVFIAVFLIPHSVLGSEIDHTKAVVK